MKPIVLVTGGAGYIGSHVCKYLDANGFAPLVLDNLSRGNRWAIKWGDWMPCDLRDKEALRICLGKAKIDAVVHFAASAYVGESVTDPRRYYQNNLLAMINLLDVMMEKGDRKYHLLLVVRNLRRAAGVADY